jgi:hypothetical protein
VLERTVAAAREALDQTGAGPAAIFLAGGSSRMPAVASVLHRAFGVAPSMVDQPELAVAEGSLLAAGHAAAADEADDDSWPALAAVAAATPVRSPLLSTRRRRVGALGAALVLVLALGAAGVALAVHPKNNAAARGGDHVAVDAARAASHSASPLPSPSPSYATGVDPCVVGTWKTTQIRSFGTIDGDREQYVGPGGGVDTYRADGTYLSDSNATQPRTVTHRGALWSFLDRGTSSGRWATANGELTTTVTTTTVTYTITRDGKYNSSGPGVYYLEPAKYTCTATSLLTVSDQGNWSADSVRE